MYCMLFLVIHNSKISWVVQGFWSKQHYETVSQSTEVPQYIYRMLLCQMMPTVIPSDLREASYLQVPTREGSPELRILAVEHLPSTQVEVSITDHPCIISATSKIFCPLPVVPFLMWIFQMFSSTPASRPDQPSWIVCTYEICS